MQPAKRPRASSTVDDNTRPAASAATPTAHPELVASAIRSLDDRRVRELLQAAALSHTDVFDSIISDLEARRRREAEREISFDYLSKSAWKELNITHAKKKSSAQWEIGHEVASDIKRMFHEMARQAPDVASYGTKCNAVETMRKICKSILLADPGELQDVVSRNSDGLPGIMLGVLKGFRDEELARLVNDEFEGEWLAKIREIVELSEGLYVLEDMGEVLAFCERAEAKSKG